MEFVTGAIVGFVIAGLIGRAKFLQVQTQLRAARDYAGSLLDRLVNEQNLSEGLQQELAAQAKII